MRILAYQQVLNSNKVSERISAADKLAVLDSVMMMPQELITEAQVQTQDKQDGAV